MTCRYCPGASSAQPAPPPTLAHLQRLVYDLAEEKGWHVPHEARTDEWVASKLCLIHSEVSEALEAIREGRRAASVFDGKPEGLPSELADVVIRVLDLAESLHIDLEAAVLTKHAYNGKRSWRHGGKRL